MRVRGALLKAIVALLAALPLSAQMTPVLSSIQSPYPPLQSKVAMPPGNASTPYPAGTVSYGPVGTPLVLSGANFGGSGSILFPAYNQSGIVAGNVTSWSNSIVLVTVPTGAGAGGVSIVPAGGTASNLLPFIVTPGAYSPSCPASPPNNQFQITTSSLPNGMAGQSYSATLSASGGTLPYAWSLTGSQQLPSGLSLNASTAVISGTPTTAAGPLTLNVEATDHSSPALISNVSLSLTIDSATVSSGPVYQYTVQQFDHTGNVKSSNDSVMGTWTFGYDHLNRLASGVPSTGVYSGQSRQLCMDYDSFGNRTQADLQTTACNPNPAPSVAPSAYDPSTASYNAANQITWLQNVAPNGLSYDGSGNVTYDGINYYSYDAEGRICAIETWPYSGGVVAYGYLYDAEGRRLAKGKVNPAPNGQAPSCDPSSNGFTLTESYVLGQGGERLTTTEWTGGAGGTSSWQSTNVYAAGKLIATYDSTGNPAYTPTNGLPAQITALHFQLTDPLGTRRIQTNSVGEAELDCQSLPFGDQLNCFPDPRAPNDNPDEDATGSTTGIHFTGKERDTESGLDYFGARYLSSSMGRWMSPDWASKPEAVPYSILDNPQSLNLYSYGWNNPLSNRDEDGHEIDLTGSDKDKLLEQQRLAANASKTDKNGLAESSLFKQTTDKSGKTTLTLDKGAAANFQGQHSDGYNLLTGAINATPVITVQMSNFDSYTGAPDSQGNVTVNLNRNVSGIDLVSPLRGFDGQPIPNPFQIIAGHEVLGHAYEQDIMHRGIQGTSADREMWVRAHTENRLRKEQGLPLRDPHSN
jgi:RHS repeat-associated protein